MRDLTAITIKDLLTLLNKREISSLELVNCYIEKIRKENEKINAYISLNEEKARKEAEQADKLRTKGINLPLLGIPVGIKDLIMTYDDKTTAGSKILSNFRAPYDAFVIKKLKKAGAITLGKLNLDEFAMGSSNETSWFGSVKNPWDIKRAPGGSSGGSAASVAAHIALATLGTDTGGSIRQPASFCGVVGLKPTYGRISRFGLLAFASSLDQIGPITRDVEDAALLLNAMAGYDPDDSTSIDHPVDDYTKNLNGSVRGMKAGVPKEFLTDKLDPEIKNFIESTIKSLESAGVEVQEISLPHTDYAVPTYYVIASAEASSNLARYDGVRYGHRADKIENLLDLYVKSRKEGFGAEVKRRIMLGTYVLSTGYYDAYYIKAQKVRTLITNDYKEAFKKVDFILTPTTPTSAFKLGEKLHDPIAMYLSDIFTVNVNLSGIPAISVPVGLDSKSLPIGAQIIGNFFDESTILKVGKFIEKELIKT